MTNTAPKEIVEVMNVVSDLVEEVFGRIKSEVISKITFVPTLTNKIEHLQDSQELFHESNSEGVKAVFAILAEEQYKEQYQSIGEMATASMGDLKEILMEDDTEIEFGKRMIEVNTFLALEQYVNGFAEVDYNVVYTLSEMEAKAEEEFHAEIVAEMVSLIRRVLVTVDEGYIPNMEVLKSMSAESFHEWVKVQGRKDTPEGIFFSGIVNSLIDVQTELGREVAGVNMKMMQRKIDSGEVHPLQLMMNISDLVLSFIDYFMTILVETYHAMKMDGKTPDTVNVELVIENIDNREE